MPEPVISICIPTYKRKDCLITVLETINSQCDKSNLFDKIEICISDNASCDGTKEMVTDFSKASRVRVVFNENNENMGLDVNLLKAVEIASGKYCWLFGSDDDFEDYALRDLLATIEQNSYDIYLLVHNSYDSELKVQIPSKKHYILRYQENRVLEISDVITDSVNSLGFLSTLVLNRELFNEKVERAEKVMGFSHVQLHIMLSCIKSGVKVFYVRNPLVKWRSGNDSFLIDSSAYRRIRLDIEAFEIIARDVFGSDSYEYKNIVKNKYEKRLINTVYCLKKNKVSISDIKELYSRFASVRSMRYKSFVVTRVPVVFFDLAKQIRKVLNG